jgi:hypothetical protein
VAQSLHPAAPSIVPGAQTSSGAGVGSAVFPPVDQSAPAPTGPVHTPYQPGPYGPPTPAPTPAPSYGYPQQGGYQPQPTSAYSPQHGVSTPPPYNLTPQTTSPASGGSGGRSGNKGVIIASIVVALVAIGGLITALTMNGGGDDDKGGSDSSASASASEVAGHKGPDTTKKIETTECTEPQESYNDPDKVEVPDFTYKYIKSVKSCFQAAGWQMEIKNVDENTFGEGMVMNQFPSAGTDVDPKKMPEIQLSVSSGNPS